MEGGLHPDIMIGGLGSDIFDFAAFSSSSPGARDTIRAGHGATAFQGAGGAAGDRIDLRKIDANMLTAAEDAFVFGGTVSGRVSLVNSGTNTVVRGNVDPDAAFEFELVIQDGAVLASAYSAGDFFL